MREIRFRGKRLDNGEWVYFNLHGAYVDENGNEISPKRFIRDCGFKVVPKTEGQYTGLKDKNGKDIYEGDILQLGESENDKGEVDYYRDGWRVKTSPKYPNDEWRTSLWDAVVDELVVIGNIYENPELLEEQT